MAVLASVFSPTIGLGSIILAVVLSAAAIGALPSRAWREERDAAKIKAERLETENTELHRENAVLLARTDLSKIEGMQEKMQAMLDQHISAVAERHALMIAALGKITGRLEFLENGNGKH